MLGQRRDIHTARAAVVSPNFSKRVFVASSWDSVTVKARGLFPG